MIEAISAIQAPQFPAEIDSMFRLRHRVFVERLNWVPSSPDGRERDYFDDLNPIYLLARAADDTLLGTWRLLPTTGPYMLRDVFPELLEGEAAPTHTSIWETSRFAVDAELQGKIGLDAVNLATRELFCGLIELCLDFGIREVITAYDIHIARLLPRIGCRPNWRSQTHRVGSTKAMAGRFEINETVLEEVRERAGICGPVLTSRLFDPIPIQKAA